MDIGTTLMLSILFGSIGAGYFIYGKKQQQFVPLLTGLALCVYPYFLSSPPYTFFLLNGDMELNRNR